MAKRRRAPIILLSAPTRQWPCSLVHVRSLSRPGCRRATLTRPAGAWRRRHRRSCRWPRAVGRVFNDKKLEKTGADFLFLGIDQSVNVGDLSPLKSKIKARPSVKSTRWRSLPGTGVIRDLATSRRFWISAFAEMTDRTRWLTHRPSSSVTPTDIDRGSANATGRLTPLLHSEVRGQLRKSQLTGSVSDRASLVGTLVAETLLITRSKQ